MDHAATITAGTEVNRLSGSIMQLCPSSVMESSNSAPRVQQCYPSSARRVPSRWHRVGRETLGNSGVAGMTSGLQVSYYDPYSFIGPSANLSRRSGDAGYKVELAGRVFAEPQLDCLFRNTIGQSA